MLNFTLTSAVQTPISAMWSFPRSNAERSAVRVLSRAPGRHLQANGQRFASADPAGHPQQTRISAHRNRKVCQSARNRELCRQSLFPVNTLLLMRGAVFARGQDYYDAYIQEVFRHMWAEPRKMDDVEVVREALSWSGLPADEILAATQDPQVKSGSSIIPSVPWTWVPLVRLHSLLMTRFTLVRTS